MRSIGHTVGNEEVKQQNLRSWQSVLCHGSIFGDVSVPVIIWKVDLSHELIFLVGVVEKKPFLSVLAY